MNDGNIVNTKDNKPENDEMISIGDSERSSAENIGSPEDQLSNFLREENFREVFDVMNEREKGAVISDLIGYMIIMSEDNENYHYIDFENCFKNIAKMWETGDIETPSANKCELLYIDPLVKKLGLDLNDSGSEKIVFEYLNNKIVKNGYVFHAYNGAFKDKVMKNGLGFNIYQDVIEDATRLQNDIFDQYGDIKPFPFLFRNFKKSADSGSGVFYSETPNNIYSYSRRSPEWFSNFLAAFDDGNLEAYASGKPFKVVESIKKWCRENNLTSEREKELLEFYGRWWESFAENKSLEVALIPRSKVGTKSNNYNYEDCKTRYLDNGNSDNARHFLGLYAGVFLHYGKNNLFHSDKISPEDLILVSLGNL